MTQAGYAQAGVQPPAINTPNDAAFFRAVFDNIYLAYNATDSAASGAVSTGVGNGGKLAKFAADGSMNFAGVSAFGALTTGSTIIASDSISTNVNLVAAGVIVAGTQSKQITTTAGLLDARQLTNTAPASIIGANTITDDMFAGLAYSISPAGALRVRVEAQNIWNGTNFIQFTQADSVAIDPSGIGTGNARIDLLYVDQSGKLQWQPGTPALASTAQLAQSPALAFVPVVYVKIYGGATAIRPADQGLDAFFYANARLKTNPLGASAISVHSLPINRLQDLAAYQTPNAGLTVNIAPGGYYNSLRTWVDYQGGTYPYTTGALNNSQPRWDLLYLTDGGTAQTATLGQSASPAKIPPTTGQYPIAYIYLPPNTTQILDAVNYTGAAGQGYILYAQGLLSAAMATVSGSSATGITATVLGGAVTGLSGFPSGSGYTNANPPAFVFTGGGGTGASAIPVLTAGVITGYTGLIPGSGYSTAPTVTVSSAGGVVPINLGGTGMTDAPHALAALGGAAAGNNGDIQSMTALTSVTSPVSFSSPVAVTGTIGQGIAADPSSGMLQGGTLVSPTSSVVGVNMGQTLKPTGGGGIAAWIDAVNGGAVDMTGITATNASMLSAYGILVNPFKRNGTDPSVYAVNTITPTGTVTSGTFAVSDGVNTTTATNVTAAIGVYSTSPDLPTTGANLNTINQKLALASILYSASGAGPLSGGNTVTLTALPFNPNRKAALTLPTNAPSGGGSLAIAQTYAGAPSIANAYGIYASQPTAGQNNYAVFSPGKVGLDGSAGTAMTDGSWSGTANLVISRNMNNANVHDSLLSIQGMASGDAGNSEKAGISVFMQQGNDSTVTPHDLCGMEMQTYVRPGNPNGRTWVMHLQSNILGAAPATDGNTVIMEMQVQNDGSDGQYVGYTPTAKQKGGISMFAGGPQNATFAYFVQTGPSNDGAHSGKFWHGYYIDPLGLVADNTNGGAFQLAGLFNVKHDGRVGIGVDPPMAGVYADVRGDIRSSGMHRFSTNTIAATVLANNGTIDPANGQMQRFNPSVAVTGINILPPAAARYDNGASAGSTPLLILFNEAGSVATQTITFNSTFNAATNALLPPTGGTLAVLAPRTAHIYIWDPAAGSWFKTA